MPNFNEKRGGRAKSLVRHDLEKIIFAYLDAAGLRDAANDAPIFQSATKNGKMLSGAQLHVNDVCGMMKRRLRDAGSRGGTRRTVTG